MDTARVSSKGQVTIPVGIRRKLDIRTGENIIFIEQSGAFFIITEKQINTIAKNGWINNILPDFTQPETNSNQTIITPVNYKNKEERRNILRTLYGCIDDQTFIEQPETEDKPNDFWEEMDL